MKGKNRVHPELGRGGSFVEAWPMAARMSHMDSFWTTRIARSAQFKRRLCAASSECTSSRALRRQPQMQQRHVWIAPGMLARHADHRLRVTTSSESNRRRWIGSAAGFLRRSHAQRAVRSVVVVPSAVCMKLALHAARVEHPKRQPLPELRCSETLDRAQQCAAGRNSSTPPSIARSGA